MKINIYLKFCFIALLMSTVEMVSSCGDDDTVIAPIAAFSFVGTPNIDEVTYDVVYTNETTARVGDAITSTWDFGTGATPASVVVESKAKQTVSYERRAEDYTVSVTLNVVNATGMDEITQSVTIPELAPVILPPTNIETFESGDPGIFNFGGTVPSVIANPVSGGINTSANVGQVVQDPGAGTVESWAGIGWNLAGKVDFSTQPNMLLMVYSPGVGQTIRLKLEDQADASINKELSAMTTVANEWEIISFTFDAADSDTYDKVILTFNPDDKSVATTHYFDDLAQQ